MSNDITIKLGESEDSGGPEFSLFHFSRIADATNNFSDENKLGEGGFGPVYEVRFMNQSHYHQKIRIPRHQIFSPLLNLRYHLAFYHYLHHP